MISATLFSNVFSSHRPFWKYHHSLDVRKSSVDRSRETTSPRSVGEAPLNVIVTQTVVSLLGPTALVPSMIKPIERPRGLPVYDNLTEILPFPPHAAFWWKRLGSPFASMLHTANYSPTAQAKFLCFLYGTVFDLMPAHDAKAPDSMMTIDGSPVELSWVMPQPKHLGTGASQAKPRQVRFAIEPTHPVSGKRLRGSAVLDYLVSPRGGLGLVTAAKDAMHWRSVTEGHMFPGDDGEAIPDGSRFFVGFDFLPNGTITLKAYYLPAPRPAKPLATGDPRPLALWDTDYDALRRLVSALDPALLQPLDLLISYFETLDDRHRPRIQIISMDCVSNAENRLKIYCRPREGNSWSDAVRSFTLGGRLKSPQVTESVSEMQRLWDCLFPQASSGADFDLRATPHESVVDDGGGIFVDGKQHPVGGLLYYYSLYAGKTSVFPKVYLPVHHYCSDDQAVARAIENYYRSSKVRAKKAASVPEGWVAKEMSDAFDHRSLAQGTGISTYVTFAMKKNGSELTTYFSPEPYQH